MWLAALLTAAPFAALDLPLAFVGEFTAESIAGAAAGYFVLGFIIRLLAGLVLRGARDSILAIAFLHAASTAATTTTGSSPTWSTVRTGNWPRCSRLGRAYRINVLDPISGGLPMNRSPWRTRWPAVPAIIALVSLVAAGPAAAAQAATPQLSWTDCGGGLQCATLSVPLDYDEPHGRRITIGVSRLTATAPERRIGSLFVNPGGPGASAEDFLRSSAQTYPADVRARFDIVGMDPRGVGRSTEVRCFGSAEQEAAFAADYPAVPVGPAEEDQAARKSRELAARCWSRSAWLLPHLSSANVARDMDVLRAAVGDERLTYAGYSYGTYLGATYAAMFPNRIRAVVLDGLLNPAKYGPRQPGLLGLNPFLRVGSDLGTAETFGQFLRACAAAPGCALTGGAGPRARYDALAARLRVRPVEVPSPAGNMRIGYGELVTATTILLYHQDFWTWGAQMLADLEAGDATTVAQFLSLINDPPIGDPTIAILCAEGETRPATAAAAAAARAADHRSRYFGRYWAYVAQACASWPRLDADRFRGPWNRPTSAPVLLVSNRYDPATPYSNAVETNQIMSGSRLLTVAGYGHTAASSPSSCARRAVADYLIGGTLPAVGATCPIDVQPFTEDPPTDLRSAAITIR